MRSGNRQQSRYGRQKARPADKHGPRRCSCAYCGGGPGRLLGGGPGIPGPPIGMPGGPPIGPPGGRMPPGGPPNGMPPGGPPKPIPGGRMPPIGPPMGPPIIGKPLRLGSSRAVGVGWERRGNISTRADVAWRLIAMRSMCAFRLAADRHVVAWLWQGGGRRQYSRRAARPGARARAGACGRGSLTAWVPPSCRRPCPFPSPSWAALMQQRRRRGRGGGGRRVCVRKQPPSSRRAIRAEGRGAGTTNTTPAAPARCGPHFATKPSNKHRGRRPAGEPRRCTWAPSSKPQRRAPAHLASCRQVPCPCRP